MKTTFKISLVLVLVLVLAPAARSTPVMFPVAQMFGGAQYVKPFTLTAQWPVLTDGTWLYAGTTTQVTPAGGTNPVVNLTPNNYLLAFSDARQPLRFGVPLSTNTLNVLNLITNGLLSLTNWTASGSFALGVPAGGSNGAAINWALGLDSRGDVTTNLVGTGPLARLPASVITNGEQQSVTFSNNFLVAQSLYPLGCFGVGILDPGAVSIGDWNNSQGGTTIVLDDQGPFISLVCEEGYIDLVSANGIVLNGPVILDAGITGSGSGLTGLSANAVTGAFTTITNAGGYAYTNAAVYPHVSGTNVVWSTKP
jgi:hypothetical protein